MSKEDPIIPFGKHRGKRLSRVSKSYMEFLLYDFRGIDEFPAIKAALPQAIAEASAFDEKDLNKMADRLLKGEITSEEAHEELAVADEGAFNGWD